MKYYAFFLAACFCLACQQSSNNAASNASSDQQNDPCAKWNKVLNGAFATKFMEGTMTWKGGINGTVDISGSDYNDMTCGYIIPDCSQQIIRMNCNGAGYDTDLILYSIDSFKLGPTAYYRVQ